MKLLKKISKWLVIIGAINWGLVGLFGYNLVESLFGGLSMYIYILVGVCGAWGAIAMIIGKKK